MQKQLRKIKQYLGFINEQRYAKEENVGEITIVNCGYKTSNTPPPISEFSPFKNGSEWGNGYESHAWFHFEFDIPEYMKDKPVQLVIKSDRNGGDANNPQFIAYINGVLRQGLDVNHTFIALDSKGHYDVYVYGYTGPRIETTRFFATLRNLNYNTEQLYYDIRVPFEMLDYLDIHSKEYAEIVTYLDHTVTILDLYEIGSADFFKSVDTALSYIRDEFYGKYCSLNVRGNVPTTVGIGHTHIDCAWLWTLKQTREKAQRSFGTALELMKQYPEYKFMSSQALLYKNVKEEAPELYEEIKKRIKEGRWEVEGSTWVEPDCNLSSGESLVRQVLYGKNFFKNEFDVDNHILWLPDVFGYSAALPQILRKSGIDWFITSKISWNDTNTMPYDTFKWIGIDGTEINTYFLTAQDQKRGESPERYATYVGNTGSKMIAGTWNRYQQKNLGNEALLTFGWGDGGGGPTAEMLEMGRRAAKGIPGVPIFKIDFVNDFFKRLGKKIENNPLLPSWQGELYLEYHRGTYTSMSKNKRYNRRCEFLLQDAEHLATMSKQFFGDAVPKETLHNDWEIVLTNQFHDIIPGSSIREVYEQSDIDYKIVEDSATEIIDNSKKAVAEKLCKNGGYAVFNPHSFVADGAVKIEGTTVLVHNIPSKGYKLTNDFVATNSVRIDSKRVETNKLIVTFDEAMQITSIYDKENNREIIRDGCVGNEIRIYADHPDAYDAWEWQEYSLDKYIALTELEAVEIIDDGARKGIRLVRPFKQSKIIQTIWFWDNIAKIDFDTVADWHQHHMMVKAVFPTNINSDKATYEIQFGTVERPTHKNTSWDRAKFEVCAQKFADLSEGGYGVSIINDCKYGHDIHGGDICLSLFKSPTYPNEVADQGEIPFVYSIYTHKGGFSQSDTTKLSYYTNYPLTAVQASGDESIIPESYSAVTIDKENVICETIKESENGDGTIIRLYEAKNNRCHIKLSSDLKFQKAYLCDLMENEISELSVNDSCIELDVGCYEIITIKLN